MAFPPNFDRAWDETFPPDTQAANLLGQDIRNFKTDIRERMSLISGTLANRPTPDASWGGVGYGMLYFATDTGTIYQWNGATWLNVSPNVSTGGYKLEYENTVQVTHSGVTNAVLMSFNLPANELAVGQSLKFRGWGFANNGGTTSGAQWNIFSDAVNLLQSTQNAVPGTVGYRFDALWSLQAHNSLFVDGVWSQFNFGSSVGSSFTMTQQTAQAFDETVGHTIGVSYSGISVGVAVTQNVLIIERIG